MSNIADLKELSSSVDFWGTTTGFSSDRLCEILVFAVNSAQKLEAAERERDELRAEIARRDAAAGEPDYWQFKSVSSDWIGIGESGMRQAVSEGVEVRPLYTAAPPGVLPPEKPVVFGSDLCQDIENYGYNLALADTRKLGAQQQKVVELPDFSESYTEVFALEIKHALTTALDAAGVKWEVKK